MTELNWNALQVRTRSETVALVLLHDDGFEPYGPRVKTRRRYSDRLKSVTEPVSAGYLFCRFDLASKKVLSRNAVERVVGCSSQHAPIPASETEAVRRMVEEGGAAAPVPHKGDCVRVIDDSLWGIEGVLLREAAAARFVVSVPLLPTSASLSIEESTVDLI